LILLGDVYDHQNDYLNSSAAYESVIENFKENPTLLEEAQKKLDVLNDKIRANSRVIDGAINENPDSNSLR